MILLSTSFENMPLACEKMVSRKGMRNPLTNRLPSTFLSVILWMEEILHQLIGGLSHYL